MKLLITSNKVDNKLIKDYINEKIKEPKIIAVWIEPQIGDHNTFSNHKKMKAFYAKNDLKNIPLNNNLKISEARIFYEKSAIHLLSNGNQLSCCQIEELETGENKKNNNPEIKEFICSEEIIYLDKRGITPDEKDKDSKNIDCKVKIKKYIDKSSAQPVFWRIIPDPKESDYVSK